ncbi:MAG: DUF169 domain-containing protein [Gammaproteobacteria bacterium]|nr:DUF169 domain-containing protein [Gammaproteobacteria bacterium]
MIAEQFVKACNHVCSTLGIHTEPVGVAYLRAAPEGADTTTPTVACQAIQDARYGKVIYLHHRNSKCFGASYFLGFEPLSERAADFWVNNEQSLCDVHAAEQMVASFPVPPEARDQVIAFFPARLFCHVPDLVIFVCNPLQVSRLLGLQTFKNGIPIRFYGYGATCQTSVGIPYHTREAGVSFIDLPSRQIAHFRENEVLVSVPVNDVLDIAQSIPLSINGTAEPRFNRKGLVYLKGEWNLSKRGADGEI